MSLNPRYIIACLISMTYISSAYALDPNSDLPIQVESDQATMNEEKGSAIYTGNVIISQGLSRLEADAIAIVASDKKLDSIIATGNPAHFVQQENETSPVTHGYGNKITYIAKDNTLTFNGNAKLVQEDNSFSGEQIEYDMIDRAIKARGDETRGTRVNIQYTPNRSNSTEPAKDNTQQ